MHKDVAWNTPESWALTLAVLMNKISFDDVHGAQHFLLTEVCKQRCHVLRWLTYLRVRKMKEEILIA